MDRTMPVPPCLSLPLAACANAAFDSSGAARCAPVAATAACLAAALSGTVAVIATWLEASASFWASMLVLLTGGGALTGPATSAMAVLFTIIGSCLSVIFSYS